MFRKCAHLRDPVDEHQQSEREGIHLPIEVSTQIITECVIIYTQLIIGDIILCYVLSITTIISYLLCMYAH